MSLARIANAPGAQAAVASPEGFRAPLWSRIDGYILSALVAASLATRFPGLGYPGAIVFDEWFTVTAARRYLRFLPNRETHPPLAAELIAMSVALFGDHPWSWRLASAVLGTVLVAITYLLMRRMFDSRIAAAIASIFILCDGQFLIDSRTAHWEIFYLTFGAWAYLMVFRFAQSADPLARRRSLAWMGLALGLSLGSKLGIPVVTGALVMSAVAFVMMQPAPAGSRKSARVPMRQIAAAFALVGGSSALVYLALYVPNYYLGFWHGVSDQIAYYKLQWRAQTSLPATLGQSSPWWSWPLMLRPMRYWTQEDTLALPGADVSSIRGIGNPIVWWAVVVAVPIVAGEAIRRKSMPRAFLVLGYITYLAMWIPISRYKFTYYYMPALYLGVLSLAVLLAECWEGEARSFAQVALLAAMAPSMILGLGTGPGLAAAAATAGGYVLALRSSRRHAGRFVCACYAAATLIAFVYFLPLWTGTPISPAALQARLWFHGPGLANWF
ncbi:MAG: phospholipid carrier-dependent glycosyltransferase [Candidatus Binatales bacterium]